MNVFIIFFFFNNVFDTNRIGTLSDDHLEQFRQLAVSKYSPDYDKLVNEMQCHTSTILRSTKLYVSYT